MNVLIAHNFYQIRGGEDQVFHDVADLLEARGHAVTRFTVHNDELAGAGKLSMATMTVWNRGLAKRIGQLVRDNKIDVVHFINTFPQISPAAYYAARNAGAAVVQEVQNFRLSCPSALFMRDNRVCEDCLGRLVAWPGIKHGCYRGSRSATAVVAGMQTFHRLLGTYRNGVDAYIAATDFSRDKLIEAGLPAAKLHVKPNFISPDPGEGKGVGGYAIFVGRLSAEKGIDVLLDAWTRLANVPLKIIGDGPLADRVQAVASRSASIDYLGRQPVERVLQLVGDAACLVFPSIWYEGLPKTILESFAKGTPVIASKIGSMIDLIEPGRNGLHVAPGDPSQLADAVRAFFTDAPLRQQLRRGARESFLERYTADRNYSQLLDIYNAAIQRRGARQDKPTMAATIERSSASSQRS